jgi:type II secretory ATPase GspE/PulE/Tfp pilus assembly ATPase PilB-like protein/ActR/RegA family two-component response regulator
MDSARDQSPDAAEPAGGHWLATLAIAEALAPSGSLHLRPGDDLEVCWSSVARASGIHQDELAARVAAHFGLQVAALAGADPRAARLLSETLMRRHLVFPLRETDHELVVAVADPTNPAIEDDVAFSADRRTVFEVAPPGAIADAIRSMSSPAELVTLHVGEDVANAVTLLEEASVEAVDAQEAEFAPVIKLTNLVLHAAVERRASDVHIEPVGNEGLVRFRVDGVMHNFMKLPRPALNRVISRIKIMGKLDIADRLRPQDGRASISVEGSVCDLRISTVPTRAAEKAVIRLLPQGTAVKLFDLGLRESLLLSIRALLSSRNGIVTVTGPTGSGKTTTLYAAIRELSTGEQNIMTVEDPIEYDLPGITQIQVEPRRGLTFASALRSVLRQDPDIILVGEIRDLETAEMAVQASMTGHLVLTTLHTNDAVGAIQRLLDLGLDGPSIAATLRGVIAQRLVRRVCPECSQRVEGELSAGERRLAGLTGVQPRVRATGCSKCAESGYRGRLPVLEVLAMSPTLTALVSHGCTMDELQLAAAQTEFTSVYQSALLRVADGDTTLEEVERVVGVPLAPQAAPVAAAAGLDPSGFEAGDEDGAAPAGNPGMRRAPATALEQTILVVDDDPVNRRVARLTLEQNGFRVEENQDGAEAIERLKTGPAPDLIVLDLQMPKVDGNGVLRWLRRTRATASIPVIVFTATGLDSEVEVMDAGADDYIRKPLQPDRFLSRIRAVLRRRG